MSNHSLFENNGNILLKGFIKDSNFNEICEKLKKDVLIELKNIDKKKIGGYLMGNLAVHTNKYNRIIYDILIKGGLERIIEEITNNKFSDYEISMGGNLNIPGGYTQHPHTDSSHNNKFIIVNVATENIHEKNGPLEIFCGTHKVKLPYWKFLLKKYNTIKFLSLSGDVIIRKSELWHRGLKNSSNETRYLFSLELRLKKNPNNQNLFNVNENIKISSNFFRPTFFGRIEEVVYCKFRFFYNLLRLIKSFYK